MFYNYWAIPSPNAQELIHLEYALPDEPGYGSFANLFIDEIKDIAVAVSPVRIRPTRRHNGHLYLRAAYRVRLHNFNEFQALLEQELVSFAFANGWELGDMYLGLTGSSTTMTQMWIIPESQSLSSVQKLSRACWQAVADGPPDCVVLEPTPADPVLGSQPLPVNGKQDVIDYLNKGTAPINATQRIAVGQ